MPKPRPDSAPPAPAVALPPIRLGNALEETIEQLMKTFRLGQVLLGDRLPPERELAEQLGVSRSTLRQALRGLKESGYLKVQAGRYGGTFLAKLPTTPLGGEKPGSADVADALRFRHILDVAAAREAAARALTSDQRRMLTKALQECSESTGEQYRPLDSRLHLAVAEATGVPSLVAAVANVRDRINKLLDQFPVIQANLDHSNDQHGQIVDAILAGDVERAAAAAGHHADGSAALIRGLVL